MKVQGRTIDQFIDIAIQNQADAVSFANKNKKQARILVVGAIVTGIALAVIFSQPLLVIPFVIFPVAYVWSYNSQDNQRVDYTKNLLDKILIHNRALQTIEVLISKFKKEKKEVLTPDDLIAIDIGLRNVCELYGAEVKKSEGKVSIELPENQTIKYIQLCFKLLAEMNEVYSKEGYEKKQDDLRLITVQIQGQISTIKGEIEHESEIISGMGKSENLK